MSGKVLSLNGITSTIGGALPLALRPSRKKLYFETTFTVQELVNCTFMTGVLYAKIQLKDGGSFSGTSHRNDVENHRVQWDQDFNFPCKMYVNVSTGVLEPCWCKISIRKEAKGGRTCTKLGYVKVNLAEYAGVGVGHRKYLLQSYNENKHKPDNSLLNIKVYLRQTAGDTIFKRPETKTYEFIPEDEGFEELWSLHSRDHRASTGSTMSSYSTATSNWSNHSGSASNLKSSTGDVSTTKDREPTLNEDRESGSEETVVEQKSNSSRADTTSTIGSHSQPLAKRPSHSGGMDSIAISLNNLTIPSITTPTTFSPTTPLITVNAAEVGGAKHSGSFKDLRHSPVLRKQNHGPPSSSLNPPSFRKSKVGSSVQSSLVTASPASLATTQHRRQASMGGAMPSNPSPLVGGAQHKRHSSFGTLTQKEYETNSINSMKTRVSILSTLEQSRVDNESLVHQLIATHDLTPASDEDPDSNLKLFVDKHSGGVKLAGHDLDKSRFKEIDVHNETIEPRPRPKPRQKARSRSEIYTKAPQL